MQQTVVLERPEPLSSAEPKISPRSSSQHTKPLRRAVVVHGGARDAYQLAAALEEAGQLEALVTDFFYAGRDSSWSSRVQSRFPKRWLKLVETRCSSALPLRKVLQCRWSGLLAIAAERNARIPFRVRRFLRRFSDARLGKCAGTLARNRGAALISYSYCGYHAFSSFRSPALLFQAHPHPGTMRRILQRELQLHPECAASLEQEWELALPEADFDRLVQEPRKAAGFIVASSFTRDSLVEHGVSAERIRVVPYGIDLQKFQPARGQRIVAGPLKVLFVGRINQRKGVSYLAEMMRAFAPSEVHLTVCGRVVDDLAVFAGLQDRVTIRPSVSSEQLVSAYQAADLFVFPSVAEGFGQVLLEALACGLPILSTSNTAAGDLIEDGIQGFVVAPRDVKQCIARIRWCAGHREELQEMRRRARQRAEHFTWQRFRGEVNAAIADLSAFTEV